MSKDPERVSSALQDADLTWLRDALDASLTTVNLDADGDLERLLRLRSLGSYGVASFVCGPRNYTLGPFIELKKSAEKTQSTFETARLSFAAPERRASKGQCPLAMVVGRHNPARTRGGSAENTSSDYRPVRA